MTRHPYLFTLATICCLTSFLPTTFGQVPVGDIVQDGAYGYMPSYDASPTVTAPMGSGVDYGGGNFGSQYGGHGGDQGAVQRLPNVTGTGIGILKDIPCGYPTVVTELGATGWGNQAIAPVPTAALANTNPLLGQSYSGGPRLAVPESNRPGIYFAYDAIYGSLSSPDIGVIGSAAAEGVYTTNGLPNPFFNSASTDILDSQPEFGHRFEFGCIGCNGGWLVSYFTYYQDKGRDINGGMLLFDDPFGMLQGYSDGNGDGIDDDNNGNRIFGRNGEDLGVENPLFNPPVNTERYELGPDGVTPIYDGQPDTDAPTDFGDLVTFIPIFDTLSIRNQTDIDGFEILHARPRRNCRPCSNGVMMLYGLRVLDIDEDFALRGTGSFFDETNIRTQIDNLIIGPTIGFNLCRRFGNWRFDGLLKSTLGLNFRRADQYGEIASNAGNNTETHGVPVNLAPSAFSNVDDDEEFAPIIEWRAGLAYCCTDWCSARIGYTGMFVDGISRAANATNYTLPSFGLNNSNDSLNFNALTFGLEFYR